MEKTLRLEIVVWRINPVEDTKIRKQAAPLGRRRWFGT